MISKTLVTICLSIFLIQTIDAQEKSEEDLILECIYSSFEDNGIALENVLLNYEMEFVKNNALKDNSAASYMEFFEKLKANASLTPIFSNSLLTERIKALPKPDNKIMSTCSSKATASKLKDIYALTDFESTNPDNNATHFYKEFASAVLAQKDRLDFDSDFIKMMLLGVLESKTYKQQQARKLEEKN